LSVDRVVAAVNHALGAQPRKIAVA
jgi:hypothetical protein